MLAVDKVVNDLTNRLRPPADGAADRPGARARRRGGARGDPGRPRGLDDVPVGAARQREDGDSTLEAAIGTGEDGFERAEQRVLYEQLAECLTDRERQIVSLRFEHDMTQEAIGKAVGVSQMQVSRVLRQAMAKLSAEACAS